MLASFAILTPLHRPILPLGEFAWRSSLLAGNPWRGRSSLDLIASLVMAAACVILLVAHRRIGGKAEYERVRRQGGSFVLGLNLMHAGYWILQPVVRRCVLSGVSAASLTWFSLVPAAGAAAATATGHWGLAAWCLLISALLDVLDGAVARATRDASPAGALLDSVLDRYAEFLVFAGIFIYYRHALGAQLITMMALFGSFLITYSTAKADTLGVTPPRGAMKRSDRLTLMILGTGFAPFSARWIESANGYRAWPVLLALATIAVLANASAVHRFIAVARATVDPAAPREPTVRTKRRKLSASPRRGVGY